MDALDQFKRKWKDQSKNFIQYDKEEIIDILKRKSSNLVKWIFVFGVLEFALWAGLSLVFRDQSFNELSNSEIFSNFSIGLELLSFGILGYFLVVFYRNYNRISMVDNTQQLMSKILKTRKTVRLYVTLNLLLLFIGTFTSLILLVNYDPEIVATIKDIQAMQPDKSFYLRLALVTIVVLTAAAMLILLIYWLTYGTLLRRLKANYKLLQETED